jgi:hypothetical protein
MAWRLASVGRHGPGGPDMNSSPRSNGHDPGFTSACRGLPDRLYRGKVLRGFQA